MPNNNNHNSTYYDFPKPHNINAEQTVIGALLKSPDVMSSVLEKIRTKDAFYSERNRELFGIMLDMYMNGKVCDIVTLLNAAMSQGIFDTEDTGKKFLFELVDNLPTVSNVISYAEIIVEKFRLRCLAEIAAETLADISDESGKFDDIIDSTEQKIWNLRKENDGGGLVHLRYPLRESYDLIGKLSGEDRDKYIGAKTGFSALDSITTGLNKSDLILLGARPGMGKTSFAMNIAGNVARQNDKAVCVFSLEMSAEQIATRLLSSEAGVESYKLRTGRLEEADYPALAEAFNKLNYYNMYIDDTALMTSSQIKARLRRVPNLGLVVIDYLQLMGSSIKTDNRVLVISEITRNLKILAKELNVPVLLLSQLSRDIEKRADKRPVLSDLRESGSIEQDADIVMFLYRDKDNPEESNLCECSVAKNRHGTTGQISLGWDGRYTRFLSIDDRVEEY
ncbi:MAG: replicative DNA helicase [Ruminococcus sp.]|jgi:replicative DNA helicase|nr:replicative DNA helicase [Ruminococcus sp.]